MTHASPPPIYQYQRRHEASAATGAALSIVGGIILAAGTLLPWIRVLDGLISRNAFELGTNQTLTIDGPALLALGVIAVVSGIVRLASGSDVAFFRGSTLGIGIISGLWLGIDFGSLYNLDKTFSVIGYGFWVACVGAVLLVIGGAVWTKEPGWLDAGIVIITLLLFVGVGALSARYGGAETIAAGPSSNTSAGGSQTAGRTPTASTGSTGGAASNLAVVTNGCASVGTLLAEIDNATIADAVPDSGSSPFWAVSEVGDIEPPGRFAQLVTDAEGIPTDYSEWSNGGSDSDLLSAVDAFQSHCAAEGFPTGNS